MTIELQLIPPTCGVIPVSLVTTLLQHVGRDAKEYPNVERSHDVLGRAEGFGYCEPDRNIVSTAQTDLVPVQQEAIQEPPYDALAPLSVLTLDLLEHCSQLGTRRVCHSYFFLLYDGSID